MVAGQDLMLNKDDYISGIELTHDGNPDRATSSMLVRHMVLNINRQVRMTRLGGLSNQMAIYRQNRGTHVGCM